MKKILVALLVAMLLLCSAALADSIAPTAEPTAKPTPAPTQNTNTSDPDTDYQPTIWDCEEQGHVWGDVIVDKVAPSCTAGGMNYYKCVKCNDAIYADPTEKLGHDFDYGTWYSKKDDVNNHYVDGICQRPGCGATDTKKEPHKWLNQNNKNVEDPTCTEAGYKYVICSVCGDEDTITLPKLGHDVEKDATGKSVPVKVVAPTCFEAGYEMYECRRCHQTETVTLAQLKHDFGKDGGWMLLQDPSCTENGLMVRYCNRPCCSNSVLERQYKETQVVKATGHKYDADRLEIVEVKGKKYITGKCIVCHEQAYTAYTGKLPATNKPSQNVVGNTATGGGNTENSTANKPTTNKAGVTIPATGETTSIAPIMMVLAIAGLAVLAATKQKVNG